MGTAAFVVLMLGIGVGLNVFWSWQGRRAKAREDAGQKKREDDREEFLKSATLVRAKVLWSFQMGTYNLMPNLQIRLRVEAPDGPFEVDVEDHVEPTKLHLLADGNMVDVYFNPAHRDRVILQLDQEFVKMMRESEKMLRDE